MSGASTSPKQPRKVGGDNLEGPRCAVIQIASVYDWLYRATMKRLRARFGTRFVILTYGDLWKSRYGDIFTDADSTIDISTIEKQASEVRATESDVYAEARRLEDKYGLLYLRDIIQQDRTYATQFLPNAPFFAVHPGRIANQLGLSKLINGYYAAFEKHLAEEQVDLVFCRPDSLYGAPLTAIAERRGIPCTFPDVAKSGDLVTWAFGAYRGSGLLKAHFDRLPENAGGEFLDAAETRYADKDFEQPDTPTKLLPFAKRLAKGSLIRAIMLAEDVRDWKFGRRTSFRTEIKQMVNRLRTARWLSRESTAMSALKDQPFVAFLLPVEPEFNTHSLAREFCNSHAIVQQIALCLPAGFKLVVKEHGSNLGNRFRSFYEDLAKLPNVVFADHRVAGTELARHARAIATISGTIGIETSLIGTPTIVFSKRTIYGFLPHIRAVTDMHELARTIHEAVQPPTDVEREAILKAGRRFYAAIGQIGFPAPESPLFKGDGRMPSDEVFDKAVQILLENHALQKQQSSVGAGHPHQAA